LGEQPSWNSRAVLNFIRTTELFSFCVRKKDNVILVAAFLASPFRNSRSLLNVRVGNIVLNSTFHLHFLSSRLLINEAVSIDDGRRYFQFVEVPS